MSVAHGHQHKILRPKIDTVGYLKGEGCISTTVLTYVRSIDKDIGNALYAVEAQKESLALPLRRNVELALVVSRGGTVHAREIGVITPRMRQADITSIVARILLLEEESPIVVQRIDFSCKRGD